MKNTSSYLPFNDHHIIKINSLDPNKIKLSTKNINKDLEKISHTSILNHIAKSLGVKGGFQGYQKNYTEELLPFLKKNGLSKHADLLSLRKPGRDCSVLQLKRQRVSERIFISGNSVPEQVFTGYNFDYKNTIDDMVYDFPYNLELLSESSSNIQPIEHMSNLFKATRNANSISDNILAIKDIKYKTIKTHSKEVQVQDIFIGGYFWELYEGFNLLGDLLVKPKIRDNVHTIYNSDESDKDYQNIIIQRNSLLDLFRDRITEQEHGWVTVIPYNKNLVFLKGENGEYDYLFKNQRNKTFIHQAFGGNLKISDVPYFIEDYSFDRWMYFEYKGWNELDNHDSERHHYMNGGSVQDYPGEVQILKTHLKSNGRYVGRSIKPISTLPTAYNFHKIKLDQKEIYVTNPVSIDEFYEFLRDRQDYKCYRSGENIDNVNADTNLTLPVSCTWYDSLAYCTWYEKKYNLPVRLPSIDEYKSLRLLAGSVEPKDDPRSNNGFHQGFEYYKDLVFSNNKGDYKGHPPYMGDIEFDALKLRFKDDLKFLYANKKIRFIDSNDFSEWNSERSCIRSGNLKGFQGDDRILRSPPLDCTGKYKHQKIGFRLCIDI